MSARHFTDRRPLHHNRFPLQYLSHADRRMIAKDLRIEREKLRDRVDEIDLAAMGVDVHA